MAKDAIKVINTVFPRNEGDPIRVSFTLNTENTNQHGVIRLTCDEFRAIENGVDGYPNTILAKIRSEHDTIEEDVHDEI